MNDYIVFLRGVMPVGKNKVPMALLRLLLEKNQFKDVSTYIQSGNVLLRSPLSAAKVETKMHILIEREFGGDIDVFVRTPQQLKEILKKDPFKNPDGKHNYYTMLSTKPTSILMKAFRSLQFAPEQIVLVDDVIYAKYKTQISDSKFNNNYFERALAVRATTRNYNTMSKLLLLATKKFV